MKINLNNGQRIFELAHEFAALSHKGQKRKDDSDYIDHPEEVSQIAIGIADEYKFSTDTETDEYFIYLITSLFHDILEDTDITREKIFYFLLNMKRYTFDESGQSVYTIMSALEALTKRDGETYLDTIKRIIDAGKYAIIVKMADNEHNMSDLNEGSLKDKYRLSHYILSKELEKIKQQENNDKV